MSIQTETHRLVKDAYGSFARQQSCCGRPTVACCGTAAIAEDHPVPDAELGLSCGNPVAFTHLKAGDVVLDLGSGGGKDVFLAAQKVGPSGHAIGIDMTSEMLELARRNTEKFHQATDMANVEFREGEIEHLPVEDASVDVVVSNCVINLSPDKPQVFREVHRVLKPGGRMVVSDIVLSRELPEVLRENEGLFVACIGGALLREVYLATIRDAGFGTVEVLTDQPVQVPLGCESRSARIGSAQLRGAAASITVLAVK